MKKVNTTYTCDFCKKEKYPLISTEDWSNGTYKIDRDFCSYSCYLFDFVKRGFVKIVDIDYHKGETTRAWDKENTIKYLNNKRKEFNDEIDKFIEEKINENKM